MSDNSKKPTPRRYEARLDPNLSTTLYDKYVIVDAETGELFSDGNGYGYDTAQCALDAYRIIRNTKRINKEIREDGTVIARKTTETSIPTRETPSLDALFEKCPDDIFLFGKCQKIKTNKDQPLVKDTNCVIVMINPSSVEVSNKQIGNFKDANFILRTMEKKIRSIDTNQDIHIVLGCKEKKNDKEFNGYKNKIQELCDQKGINVFFHFLPEAEKEISQLVLWPSLLKKTINPMDFSFKTINISGPRDHKSLIEEHLFKMKLLTSAFGVDDIIPDASSIIGDFYISEKSLGVLFTGTGKGKSYAIRQFMRQILRLKELGVHRRCFVITDRKINVEMEYQSFLQDCSKLGTDKHDIFHLQRNGEYLIDGFDILEKMKNDTLIKEYIDVKYINSITSSIALNGLRSKKISEDELKKKRDSLIDEDSFKKNEEQLRYEFKRMIRSHFKKLDIRKDDKDTQRAVLERDFPLLCALYPFMFLCDSHIIFCTTHRFFSPVDTLWNGKVDLGTSAAFLKDSFVFMDEADASYVAMLEMETKKCAEDSIELRYFAQVLGDAFQKFDQFPRFGHTNEKVKADVEELQKMYAVLCETYKLNMGFRNCDTIDDQFMFFDPENNIPVYSKGDTSWYIDFNDYDGIMELTNEETESSQSFLDYVSSLNNFINHALIVCKKLCEMYREWFSELNTTSGEQEIKYTPIESCYAVLSRLGIDENNSHRNTIALNVMNITKKEIEEGVSTDIYIRPNSLISTSKKSYDEINTKIHRYALVNVPERRLLNMLQSGAKVLLSSATMWNQAVHNNFDLSWEAFQPYLYKPSKHTLEHEIRYAKSMEEFKRDINIEKTINTTEMERELNSFLRGNIRNQLFGIEEYDQKRYIKLIHSIFKFLSHGYDKVLCSVNKDLEKNDQLRDIFEELEKTYDAEILIANSKNIDSQIKKAQNYSLEGKKIVLISTYSSISKGINIKFSVKYDADTFDDNFHIINKTAIESMKSKIQNSKEFEFETDFNGLYLEKQTYLMPSINIDGKYREKVENMLACMAANDKLCIKEEITKDAMYSNILRILRKDKFPFDQNLSSWNSKRLLNIVQTVGRISRCSVQHNNTLIILDDQISLTAKGLRHYINEDDYEQAVGTMTYKVKAVCDHLFKSNMKTTPKNAVAIARECKKSSNNIAYALQNIYTQPSLYRDNYTTLRHLSIDEEEYQNLSPEQQDCYFRFSGDGYSYTEFTIQNGHRIAEYALPLSDGKYQVSIDSIPLCGISRQVAEKNGFSFDSTKEYKMTPAAFDRFKGNVGECIAEHYLNEYCFEALPSDCYEKMDGFFNTGTHIIAFDPKLFSVMDPKFDQKNEKLPYFYNKCKPISERYGNLPLLAIIINSGYTPFSARNEVVSMPFTYNNDQNIQFITIPNIFTERKGKITWSEDVKTILSYRISEFFKIMA